MKKIIYLLIPLLFASCYKYAEQTTPTLSGEYIIDRITVTENETTSNPKDSVYLPGDIYLDPNSYFPLDSVYLGITRWHFDYMEVAFCPVPNQWGSFDWQKKCFYDLIPGSTIYDFGYVQLKLNGTVLTFHILSDGTESLLFRTTGQWTNDGFNLTEKTLTIQFTRIGP